jgi:predicted nucleotidyltransferase
VSDEAEQQRRHEEVQRRRHEEVQRRRHEEVQRRRHEEVMVRAVDVLDQAGIPYALMGGLAVATVGRGRTTKDVDLFVHPDHAEAALEALARAGFRTERTDPAWIYKAFWGENLVDLIFESSGGILFDEELQSRRRVITVLGREVKALAAEDILVIKALANEEHRPRHWHDGLAILGETELDWAYLVHRARPYAPRVLSLLLYAVSDGSRVSAEALRELFDEAMRFVPRGGSETEREHHLAARVREALATNPEIAEPDVSVVVSGGQLVVRGQVATEARKVAIEDLLHRLSPHTEICSELQVAAE